MAASAVASGLAHVRHATERECGKVVRTRINVLKSQWKIDAFHGVDRTCHRVHWVVDMTAKTEGIVRKSGVKYITMRIDDSAFPTDAYIILLVRTKLRRVFEVRKFSTSHASIVLQVLREHDLAIRSTHIRKAARKVEAGQPLIVETLRRTTED